MLRIGLTGGIGSGKSAVAEEFRRLGVPVIDTDEIARELVEPGRDAFREIVAVFGPEILEDGKLSRARLRARVFADPGERKRLEGILHPRIREEIARQIARLRAPYCVIVIPLLVETGLANTVERVLVVEAPENERIARLMRNRGLSREEIVNIIAAQTSSEERLAASDDVISNNGALDDLRPLVARLDRRYREFADRKPS